MKLLTKRLLSSSSAFACTWGRHVEGLSLDEVDIEVTAYAIDRAEMAMNDGDMREKIATVIESRCAAGKSSRTYVILFGNPPFGST